MTQSKNTEKDDTWVRQVCDLIDACDGSAPTLSDLGQAVGLSPYHVQRRFKQATGISPREYAETRRHERFKSSLRHGDPVTTALYDAGYSGPSRVYERAKERLGMTPASYRRGGLGAVITYGFGPTPVGQALVAATGHGLCLVGFGDTKNALISELKTTYPKAHLDRNDDGVAHYLDTIRVLTDLGSPAAFPLPLDIEATAFQWKVWEALQLIPRGETLTYGAIAAQLGKPKAARAVGRACATNPVALVIPCHRAIGATGSLTGYRWGTDRKKMLLEFESAGTAV